jgi:hypothetical protein
LIKAENNRVAVGVDIVEADTALQVGYATPAEFEGRPGASSIFICVLHGTGSQLFSMDQTENRKRTSKGDQTAGIERG